MSNRVMYGIRFNKARKGNYPLPAPVALPVASGQAFNVNGGAQNARLQAGDPVRYVAGTGLVLCDGTEGASGAQLPTHIVAGVAPYWDGEVMTPSTYLPSGVVYGALLERQSFLHVFPVEAGYWEIDCDENITADSLADYQALIGRTVDIQLHGAAGELDVNPLLDISTEDSINAQHWRIANVSDTKNNENFDAERVKLIIEINDLYDASDT